MLGPYQPKALGRQVARDCDRMVLVSRDVLTRASREPDRTVTFGPTTTDLYDVWLGPAAEVTVVLVHGGFWRAQWDRAHLRPLATALADAGLTVALPEYRRTGMPGGTWPGPGSDLAAALTAIRADDTLPEPTVLVGHSAGGHLAVWLLHRPEGAGLLGAVSLAGCLDLRMIGRLGLDDGAADDLMGGTDWHDAPFLGADPMDLGPTPSTVALVHGDADDRVPLAVSESWMTQCGTPGRDTLTVLEDTDHFDLIDPESSAWPVLLEHLGALSTSHPRAATRGSARHETSSPESTS